MTFPFSPKLMNDIFIDSTSDTSRLYCTISCRIESHQRGTQAVELGFFARIVSLQRFLCKSDATYSLGSSFQQPHVTVSISAVSIDFSRYCYEWIDNQTVIFSNGFTFHSFDWPIRAKNQMFYGFLCNMFHSINNEMETAINPFLYFVQILYLPDSSRFSRRLQTVSPVSFHIDFLIVEMRFNVFQRNIK